MVMAAEYLSRSAKAARRRAEIVEIAAELFARKGFRGTGLAEVAARAGIAQAGLLHHFKSKKALLHAVIERRDADSEAFATELLGADLERALEDMPSFARRNREQPEIAKLFTVLVAENLEEQAPAHEHFVERYRSMRVIIATILRNGQAAGRIRADIDVELQAAEIVATLDGLQIQWLLDPDRVDIVRSVDAYAAGLRRSLVTSDTPPHRCPPG
jgi:AcrR family transcriptional regulator